MPSRVRDDLAGLEPCDPLEDLVLASERRSELLGVILREGGRARVDAKDVIHCAEINH